MQLFVLSFTYFCACFLQTYWVIIVQILPFILTEIFVLSFIYFCACFLLYWFVTVPILPLILTEIFIYLACIFVPVFCKHNGLYSADFSVNFNRIFIISNTYFCACFRQTYWIVHCRFQRSF